MNKRYSKPDYYVYFLPTAFAYRSMHYLRVLRFDGYTYVFFLNVKLNGYETKKMQNLLWNKQILLTAVICIYLLFVGSI